MFCLNDRVIMKAFSSILCCLILNLSYNDATSSQVRRFPKHLKFGAATAAYQIEGGWNEDGKSPSIWDTLTHTQPDFVHDSSNGDHAANSYHLWKRDVEMIKELGLDFYRFSISWSRILPNGFTNYLNKAGIKYYSDLINELLNNGITPMVTLYHWDLPDNLQKLGGFANRAIVNWFEDYANVVFDSFGDRVKHWITFNEPKSICYEGYGSDAKAPALNLTGIGEYICAKNLLLAHAKMYHLYDQMYRPKHNGTIGISISCTWFEPGSDRKEDSEAAEDARQFDWGQYAHPIFSTAGDFPANLKQNVQSKSAEQGFRSSRLPTFTAEEIEDIKGSSDFFGLNAYTSKLAFKHAGGRYLVPSYLDDMGAVLEKDPSWPQSQSSWLQAVPWGFKKLLGQIRILYNNPAVWVTENGWSTTSGLQDDSRIEYYQTYLSSLIDAIGEGSDVRGYTAWSLMDNFEWKSGYAERFGLYEVNFNDKNYTRTPRKSALMFKNICKTKILNITINDKN